VISTLCWSLTNSSPDIEGVRGRRGRDMLAHSPGGGMMTLDGTGHTSLGRGMLLTTTVTIEKGKELLSSRRVLELV
jgi:hypothetical protein